MVSNIQYNTCKKIGLFRIKLVIGIKWIGVGTEKILRRKNLGPNGQNCLLVDSV